MHNEGGVLRTPPPLVVQRHSGTLPSQNKRLDLEEYRSGEFDRSAQTRTTEPAKWWFPLPPVGAMVIGEPEDYHRGWTRGKPRNGRRSWIVAPMLRESRGEIGGTQGSLDGYDGATLSPRPSLSEE